MTDTVDAVGLVVLISGTNNFPTRDAGKRLTTGCGQREVGSGSSTPRRRRRPGSVRPDTGCIRAGRHRHPDRSVRSTIPRSVNSGAQAGCRPGSRRHPCFAARLLDLAGIVLQHDEPPIGVHHRRRELGPLQGVPQVLGPTPTHIATTATTPAPDAPPHPTSTISAGRWRVRRNRQNPCPRRYPYDAGHSARSTLGRHAQWRNWQTRWI